MATVINSKKSHETNFSSTPLIQRFRPLLASTVGSKYLVAITGLLLTGFVIGHLSGNLLIYAGQDALNSYAEFLKSKGVLLWGARIGLLAVFVLHLALALRLRFRNATARPVPYAYEDTVQASWASRNMAITGILVGLFVVYHLLHFTAGVTATARIQKPTLVHNPATGTTETVTPVGRTFVNYLNLRDAKGRHDVYSMVIYGFKKPLAALVYIAAQIALLFHLSHGIGSIFQSLGLNAPKYATALRRLGLTVAALIALGNISIPVAVLLGVIKLPPGMS